MSTIKDVARLAGVGIGTVSRVLNQSGAVNPDTAERVWHAVERLAYRPNANARRLVTQRSYLLGVVLPDLTNPFFPSVVRAIETYAAESGYFVIVLETDWDADQEYSAIEKLCDQAVDGLILISCSHPQAIVEAFAPRVPLVMVDRRVDNPAIAQITVDHYRGATEAVHHLIQKGHTNIGFIAGRESDSARQRLHAYEDVMVQSGNAVRIWQGENGYTFEAGYVAMQALVGRVSAVFAANDLSALGALKYLQEQRMAIPADMALVGFDDVMLSSLVHPRLTTVHQPVEQLGEESARLAIALIEQAPGESRDVRRVLQPRLVVREST